MLSTVLSIFGLNLPKTVNSYLGLSQYHLISFFVSLFIVLFNCFFYQIMVNKNDDEIQPEDLGDRCK